MDQDEHDDPRRLRAIGIHLLEKAAAEGGHTLLGATSLHELAKELPATRPVPLDATAARLCKDEFGDEITVLDAPGVGGLALQLKRYTTYGSIIRRAIAERVKGKITPAKIDWPEKLDKGLWPAQERRQRRSESARGRRRSLRMAIESPGIYGGWRHVRQAAAGSLSRPQLWLIPRPVWRPGRPARARPTRSATALTVLAVARPSASRLPRKASTSAVADHRAVGTLPQWRGRLPACGCRSRRRPAAWYAA